jgi:hypothetical protein
LQQRALAGAVLADNAERFATLNLEADVVESREVMMERNPIQAGSSLRRALGDE